MPTNGCWKSSFTVFLVFVFPLFMETVCRQTRLIHVPVRETWFEARQYCRRHHSDLAVLTSAVDSWDDDQQLMCDILSGCWIGLFKDKNQVWSWSNGEELKSSQQFLMDAPEDASCGVTDGVFLFTEQCNERYTFLCDERLILVKEKKTWEEALEHCMALDRDPESAQPASRPRYSLAYVDMDGADSEAKREVLDAETEEVWIGLRFLAGYWLWMNGNPLQEQPTVCPQPGRNCGAMSKTGRLLPQSDCLQRRNFFCSERNRGRVDQTPNPTINDILGK